MDIIHTKSKNAIKLICKPKDLSSLKPSTHNLTNLIKSNPTRATTTLTNTSTTTTTSGISQTNITGDFVVSNDIIANTLQSNQVIPNYTDITNLGLYSSNQGNGSFNFTDMNRYLYPDLSDRTTSSVTNQTADIINYIYNNNGIMVDISNNDNSGVSTSITIPIINNSNYDLNVANGGTQTRWTTISKIPNIISNLYTNYSPSINPTLADTSYNKLVSSSVWSNTINLSSAGLTSLPSSYTLINYDASNVSGVDSSFNSAAPSWGPPVLNQGQLGSCYSFSTAEAISYGYIRYLINTNNTIYNSGNSIPSTAIADASGSFIIGFGNNGNINIQPPNSSNSASTYMVNFANYMLPCLSYIEQLSQNLYSLNNFTTNIFSQGGFTSSGIYSYLIQDACPLEFQYTYPALNIVSNTLLLNGYSLQTNNSSNQVIGYDTQTFLVEEWIRKRIHDIPSYITDSAKAAGFYKFNPINGAPINFNILSVCNNSMLTSNNIINNQSNINIIMTNIKTLLCNNYAISIGINVNNNPPVYKNGFPVPYVSSEGGHAILIVGYDDNYQYTDPSNNKCVGCFIIQNSWSSTVGVSGYYVLPYTHVNYLISSGNTSLIMSCWYAVNFY